MEKEFDKKLQTSSNASFITVAYEAWKKKKKKEFIVSHTNLDSAVGQLKKYQIIAVSTAVFIEIYLTTFIMTNQKKKKKTGNLHRIIHVNGKALSVQIFP